MLNALRVGKWSWVALALGLSICSFTLLSAGSETPVSLEQSRQSRDLKWKTGREITPRKSSRVAWCAAGGAPIVGLPVVDAQERVYVATSDGYLHAFERDGRFRWSYTVKGTPLGSVSLRPSDGGILIGTTARFLYAINQSGRLDWSFHTLTPVWSGLFELNPSTVVFLGQDERLYALKNRTGGARYRVHAPGLPMGGPIVAPKDVVWLALAEGAARFVSAQKLEKFYLPSATEQLVIAGSKAVARAGGMAYVLETGKEPRTLGKARFLAGDGRRVVLVDEAGEVDIFDEEFAVVGEKIHSGRDESSCRTKMSSPPLLRDDRLWVPRRDGSLSIIELSDGKQITVQVGDRPLSTPVVGPSGQWAIVSDHSGTFCAVDLAQ